MLSITLDWLAFTYKENTHEMHDFMALYASDKNSHPATAYHGYSASYQTEDGVICSWNDDRQEMGYHVVLGGSAIRALCTRKELSQETLLREVIRSGASVTRLDLATDLREVSIQLSSIWSALESGHNRGSSRKFGQIVSNDGGHTIYVGSRQSEKFIRVYDKAAQEGLPQELWFRFEIETKGMVARALAKLLLDTGQWKNIFDGCALGMVDLRPNSSFEEFFRKGDVPIGVPKLERQTDRERWIAEQVVAAVAKHYIENPYSSAVTRLIDTLLLIAQQRGMGPYEK